MDYIANQIANHIAALVNKKNKNANAKANSVKNYLWVFVNALIDNPAFDSQTKETLTLRQSSFGSACELPAEFLKKGMQFCSGFIVILINLGGPFTFKSNRMDLMVLCCSGEDWSC